MPFVKGQSGNPKGKPKGAPGGGGRRPEWLKEKCRQIVEERNLVGFLADVASGEDIDQVVTDQGECLKVPAHVKDRLKATEMLMDRGFGKPVSLTDLGDGEAAFIGVVRIPQKDLGTAGGVKDANG